MVEISEAAKAKACELLNIRGERMSDGVARFIQQVSDAAKGLLSDESWSAVGMSLLKPALAPFILPEPVDPLVAVLAEANEVSTDPTVRAAFVRNAIHERGIEIGEARK